ncbi:MAG: hypothetical protein HYY25_17315 [Candidatus Wallbacteria bacterium]|nr:hypothetical protein [Candidatus Wallbacteria bacterium]
MSPLERLAASSPMRATVVMAALLAAAAGSVHAQQLIRTRTLELYPGLNLLSMPLAARTTRGAPLDAAALTDLTGAVFVARPVQLSAAPVAGRFEVQRSPSRCRPPLRSRSGP